MLTYWAPTVNLDRDPRWGRTDEAFGEDPYFAAQMAGAFVNGYQGQTPDGSRTTQYLKVAATAKHYALNDVEHDRTGISSDVSDTDLRDYYTAQFRSLIENAHVVGPDDVVQRHQRHAVAGQHLHHQPARAAHLRLRRLHHLRLRRGRHHLPAPARATTGRRRAGPPTTRARAPTWTNTATGATVSGAAGGQAYALRAGTNVNCTGAEATSQNIRAGHRRRRPQRRRHRQRPGAPVHRPDADRRVRPAGPEPYTKITKDVDRVPASTRPWPRRSPTTRWSC